MRVKNNKVTIDTWVGQEIQAGAEYDIQTVELSQWKSNDKVIQDLSTGNLLIGDGITYKPAGANAVAYLLEANREVIVSEQPAFSTKKVGSKKLFTRATGAKFAVIVGVNMLDFVVPYNEVKFNGVEICNGSIGDTVSLKILDTPSGTISGVPNYTLNQFGFNLNLPNGFYLRESQYDADLIKDLKIRVEYTAISAGDVMINYIIHELKA